MFFNPCLDLGSHECKIFRPLDKQEINYRGSADTSEDSDFPLEIALVIERENHARQELDNCPEEKCYRHRQENTENDRQGFLRVQQVIEAQPDTSGHFDERYHEGGSEEFKDHRHRSGCRQPQ